MKSQALQRVTSLVIAIALVMIDANIVCGQRDVDPAPTPAVPTAPKKKVTQANATASKPSFAQPNLATPQVGKTTVKQASATKQAATTQRSAIPGTENTKVPSSATPRTDNAVTTAAASGTGSAIKQVGYEDATKGINLDGQDPLTLEKKQRLHHQPSAVMTPPAVGIPPAVHGAYGGLGPGETSTEKLIRVQVAYGNLERENQELRQLQAQLQAKLKERDEQLLIAIREIQMARKEVGTARVDLDRLKGEVQSLREKARSSEKEHESLLRSMGPLLQQLLEGHEVSALPPNPPE